MSRSGLILLFSAACAQQHVVELDPNDTTPFLPDDVVAVPSPGFDLYTQDKVVLGRDVTLYATYPDTEYYNQTVLFGWSSAGLGAGGCPAVLGGSCVDILAPARLLGASRAGGRTAALTTFLPSSLPGTSVATQAALRVSGGAALMSNAIDNPFACVDAEVMDVDNDLPTQGGASAGNRFQSFTATTTGVLTGFAIQGDLGGTGDCIVFTLYEGEGTAGRLLSRVEECLTAPHVAFDWYRATFTDNPWITAGQQYSVQYHRTVGDPIWLRATTDQYLGGSLDGDDRFDIDFQTFVEPEIACP